MNKKNEKKPEEIEREVRGIEVDIGGFAFIPPSSTYHKFTTGLTGGKMSSSKPESYISLLETPENAAKKVMKAFTGGRATAEEQRKLGGEPERCVIFELLTHHLIERDEELEEIRESCKSGKLLCGRCKKMTAERVSNFIKEHHEMRCEVEAKLDEYMIIS